MKASSTTGERILILDFGSQYTQVIARRIRECKVYSEILPFHTKAAHIRALAPSGIILSGGPASVYEREAPQVDRGIFDLGIPILGICYGLQLIAQALGGRVEPSEHREYGPGKLATHAACPLFHGLPRTLDVWNSHGDRLTRMPRGFAVMGHTENSPRAVIGNLRRRIFGLQFHPEVVHTPRGRDILANFVHRICGCQSAWTTESFIERTCREIREQVGSGRVLLGLSGGVDSSVAAALLHKAIGKQLTCVFVDNGLLRLGEVEGVRKLFRGQFQLRLITVNASGRFLAKLRGVTDPERKRKIIGKEFIKVFEEEARKLRKSTPGDYRFLAQGTVYPDVIESIPVSGNPSALIKSHHNVGGLPERMHFELVEPLRQLFKDEVRRVGLQLGLSKDIVNRQPFPGPGLAVRILGAITPERLRIVRAANAIVLEEIRAAGWYEKVWQSFAVLLPIRSVGVMGDERTYDYTIVLRVVQSHDGMTADWVRLPAPLLARISSRVTNEVKGVNRLCYDISSKPPATIEWE